MPLGAHGPLPFLWLARPARDDQKSPGGPASGSPCPCRGGTHVRHILSGAVNGLGSPYPCDFSVASPPFRAIDRFDDPFCFKVTYSLVSYAISDKHEVWRWSHHTGIGSALLWGYLPFVVAPAAVWLSVGSDTDTPAAHARRRAHP